MGRTCCDCDEYLDNDSFSRNQWMKGDGYSRRRDCVSGFKCHVCNRYFNNQNELNMHSQTHRPRNVSCPVCGESRFGSGANAVQHVESGYCSGCPGADHARQQIYDFASQRGTMNRYMTDVPRLTYGGYESSDVPDFPYHCSDCNKYFRQMSQLLQHLDNKHNTTRLLTY